MGWFPDAPTQRGVKHLRELTAAVKDGWECCVAFVITMPGVTEVRPNGVTDPAFEQALADARAAGVRVLRLPCEVSPQKVTVIDALISK